MPSGTSANIGLVESSNQLFPSGPAIQKPRQGVQPSTAPQGAGSHNSMGFPSGSCSLAKRPLGYFSEFTSTAISNFCDPQSCSNPLNLLCPMAGDLAAID
jgi:hypothetical protein